LVVELIIFTHPEMDHFLQVERHSRILDQRRIAASRFPRTGN
jgi:hypothetical protein